MSGANVQYSPHFSGGTLTKANFDFVPPHRSGQSAVRESWDLLTRRIRWLMDNTYMIKRAVSLMVQLVVGEGINVFHAAVGNKPPGAMPDWILADPLFRFGEESDVGFERWAQKYADTERRRTWYEMQTLAASELFGSGNAFWLKVVRPAPAGVCPLSYQLLEAEQLDRTRDRPGTETQGRIDQGVEYDAVYDEPVAYWIYDAHPYDSLSWFPGAGAGSRRIPANRVIHLALTTRASQRFGVSFANILMQPGRDEDWLVGHELTSAALAAGLTILIREAETGENELKFDDQGNALGTPAAFGDAGTQGVPHISEVGLTSGMIAKVRADKNEDVKVIETSRPNKDVEPFARFLLNRASMATNLSYHRYTGNPTGASFAALRAMINDDRSATLPLTNAIGRRLSARCREVHDGTQVALGRYHTVTAAQYGRDLASYQDYDVLGPPLRLLNPQEDIAAAAARIRCGMSTLRRECGLLGLNYRQVLRQLTVEADLSTALGVVLDFSSGGGMAATRTTTAAETPVATP